MNRPEDAIPTASDLVHFIRGSLLRGWPLRAAEIETYLSAQRIEQISALEATDQQGLRIARVDVPVAGISFATVSVYEDDFFGLTLHLYMSAAAEDPGSRRGFEALREHFDVEFGTGVDAWSGEDPPRTWSVEALEISTHYSSKRESGVMLSIDSRDVAARAERDALARTKSQAGRSQGHSVPSGEISQ